jgi:uncharacterized membrane protein YbaN (DUF454 family)
MVKPIYLLLGMLSLGLGILGAFLPILPTTPFAILAAFCFSKSSPKWHAKVLNMPMIGPLVIDWQNNRVIRKRAKWACTGTIIVVMGSSMILGEFKFFVNIVMALIGVGVLIFIWSQKSEVSAQS